MSLTQQDANTQVYDGVAVCSEHKEQTENYPNFISTIITDDQSWIYGYGYKAAFISVEYAIFIVTQESMTGLKQCHFSVDFFFDDEGIMNKKFVLPGPAVNGNFYCDVLWWLKENIWHKCPVKWCNSSSALHHDNAPAQTAPPLTRHALKFFLHQTNSVA
jgi:hypothetical protein